MQQYHDEEWGTPCHEDIKLFEIFSLEIAQAGLSWRTILNKRSGYRKAFYDFDFQKISKFGQAKTQSLLSDTAIVRNKAKILAVINNANRALEAQVKFGSLDSFFWSFVTNLNQSSFSQNSILPQVMAKELKREGWKFIGPTICESFMQAAGLVNGHTGDCFRKSENL